MENDPLVFGVCARIARRLGVTDILVRVACAALILITGGIAVITYGTLALVMPAERRPVAPWSAPERWVPALLLAALLAAATYGLQLQVVSPPLGVLISVALLGAALGLRLLTR